MYARRIGMMAPQLHTRKYCLCLYFWISTTHQSLASVRLFPGLDLESLPSQLNRTSGIWLGKEAESVEGHLQLWGGAHKDCSHWLVISQPHEPHLDYRTLVTQIQFFNVAFVVQVAFSFLLQETQPVVEARHLPVLHFPHKHMLKPR